MEHFLFLVVYWLAVIFIYSSRPLSLRRKIHYLQGKNIFQVLEGNTDRRGVVTTQLREPRKATFVRIQPKKWNGAIALRLEIYGCMKGRRKKRLRHGKCARTIFILEFRSTAKRTSERSERLRFLLRFND